MTTFYKWDLEIAVKGNLEKGLLLIKNNTGANWIPGECSTYTAETAQICPWEHFLEHSRHDHHQRCENPLGGKRGRFQQYWG